MSNTKVYDGKFSNGVAYEIHHSTGFSNQSELAVKIGDAFITVIKSSQKRNGNIEFSASSNGKVIIKTVKDLPAESLKSL